MVMFGHFFMRVKFHISFIDFFLEKISILGQLGVALFFVLSGFLITRILLKTKKENNYFKNFYFRRILRIFPLYYFFLILFYFILPFLFNTQYASFSQLSYFIFYIQNFAQTFNWNAVGPSHFWSLAVEEHFYMFWPFFVYFLSNKQLLKLSIIIIFFTLLLRSFFILKSIDVYYFTFTRFDSLAIGAILALVQEKNGIKEHIIKIYKYIFLIITLLTFVLWVFYGGESIYLLQVFKYTIFSVCFYFLIGFVVFLKKENFISVLLSSKFLVYTGKISYGLYVYHLLAFYIIESYLKTNYIFIDFIISFILAYVISILSYHFFEVKFLNFKKYFNK
jgi:peptidoglycan/LPS O-acetylase OafA/YrhL